MVPSAPTGWFMAQAERKRQRRRHGQKGRERRRKLGNERNTDWQKDRTAY